MDTENRQYYYNVFLSISIALIIVFIFKLLLGIPTMTVNKQNIKETQ